MKKEKEIVIISGFIGLAIGVCSMMAINVNKEVKQVERFDETKFIISENINTCEDIIEWMNEDNITSNFFIKESHFDTYIYNLENMIENNRNILQTKYDY